MQRITAPSVRHGIYAPPFATFGDVRLLVELAQAAEEDGWDGFFLWDHILYESAVPLVDAWVALAAIARPSLWLDQIPQVGGSQAPNRGTRSGGHEAAWWDPHPRDLRSTGT